MNNGTKTVVGTLIGAGVAYAISQVLEREVADPVGFAASDTPSEPKESFKDRWERAKSDGEAARVAKEEELRSYFRQKVSDPRAFVKE